jgi:hypothetical protein
MQDEPEAQPLLYRNTVLITAFLVQSAVVLVRVKKLHIVTLQEVLKLFPIISDTFLATSK